MEVTTDNQRLQNSLEDDEQKLTTKLGPKTFQSSIDMFNYFFNLLHHWPPNLNLIKYEHLVLLELLTKGHVEAETKIGAGVRGFRVGNHPLLKNKCFFLLRRDGSVDDFSFRKCVHHILPLPLHMVLKSNDVVVNPQGNGRGGRGRGRGRGRRGHGRAFTVSSSYHVTNSTLSDIDSVFNLCLIYRFTYFKFNPSSPVCDTMI